MRSFVGQPGAALVSRHGEQDDVRLAEIDVNARDGFCRCDKSLSGESFTSGSYLIRRASGSPEMRGVSSNEIGSSVASPHHQLTNRLAQVGRGRWGEATDEPGSAVVTTTAR